MSNGLTPEDQPDTDPASLGHGLGRAWANNWAGTDELGRLVREEHANHPDLLRSLDSDQAILEITRILMPPCALHLDSARAYWELVLGSGYEDLVNSVPFIATFLEGAISAARARVRRDATMAVDMWLFDSESPELLENVEAFVRDYGSTWENSYPDGCNDAFDVCHFMGTGEPPYYLEDTINGEEGLPIDGLMIDFYEDVHINHHWAKGHEHFGREFIRCIVDIVQQDFLDEGRSLVEFLEEEDDADWSEGYDVSEQMLSDPAIPDEAGGEDSDPDHQAATPQSETVDGRHPRGIHTTRAQRRMEAVASQAVDSRHPRGIRLGRNQRRREAEASTDEGLSPGAGEPTSPPPATPDDPGESDD